MMTRIWRWVSACSALGAGPPRAEALIGQP
jgi:hypothetical protein